MTAELATEETSQLIASDKVEGTAVYDRNEEHIGSIHNFMVGKTSGQVEYAVLQFGGVFGLGSDYYPIPWKKLRNNTAKGGYVVDSDRSALETGPRFADGGRFDESLGERARSHYEPAPLS